MSAKTYAELYTDALQQADEIAGSGSAIAKTIIKAGINEAYMELSGMRDWDQLKNTLTFPTVAGTNEYNPRSAAGAECRIRRILSVVDQTSNRYLDEVTQDNVDRTYPFIDTSDTTKRGAPTMWYLTGFNTTFFRDVTFKVYAVPDQARTLRVLVIEDPLELETDDTIPRLPDQFHYPLTYLGLAKYYEYQKDPVASYYRQLHETTKQKVLDYEYSLSDEMPAFEPTAPPYPIVTGKIGRVYNR